MIHNPFIARILLWYLKKHEPLCTAQHKNLEKKSFFAIMYLCAKEIAFA